MIFLTVGNMDPFDLLIRTVDDWIATNQHPGMPVSAQIGKGNYLPTNFEYVRFLSPKDFIEKFKQAKIVISHAGMGTIITAMELSKPIIVMPKRATLGEQRNEHQLATVRHFQRSKQIYVADSEQELPDVLNRVLNIDQATAQSLNDPNAWHPDESLIRYVSDFVSDR